jgi:uncharacterized membrane protein
MIHSAISECDGSHKVTREQKDKSELREMVRRNPRFLVDVALVIPFVIGVAKVIAAASSLHFSEWHLKDAAVGAGLIFGALLLAKERAVMLGAAFSYMFIMLVIRLPFATRSQVLPLLLAALVSGASLWGIAFLSRDKNRLYESKNLMLDRLIAVAALIAAAIYCVKLVKDFASGV